MRDSARQISWIALFVLLIAPGAWADATSAGAGEGDADIAYLAAMVAELEGRLTEVADEFLQQSEEFEHLAASVNDHLRARGVPTIFDDDIDEYPSKTIFLSSQDYSGALGGLGGADSKCQGLADQANLPGTYKAWLSTSNVDARFRLVNNFGPYRLPNGVLVAESFGDLVDGTLQHPINVTEKKTGGSSTVWTATTPSGQLHSAAGTCTDWFSSGGYGGMGLTHQADSNWTRASGGTCTSFRPIYCLEQ